MLAGIETLPPENHCRKSRSRLPGTPCQVRSALVSTVLVMIGRDRYVLHISRRTMHGLLHAIPRIGKCLRRETNGAGSVDPRAREAVIGDSAREGSTSLSG